MGSRSRGGATDIATGCKGVSFVLCALFMTVTNDLFTIDPIVSLGVKHM